MGMTEADLRADIREQLVVDQLIQQETDFLAVTVNEADVAAYYEAISANNPELPPLENIAAELEANLRQQKQQQVVSDYIQTLRAEAEIEVLI
jgi:HPt (histidine-containing phosphotransfer) domain-containing protein